MMRPNSPIIRRAKLAFTGKLAANTTLTASDWRIEVSCGACGFTHNFDLSLVDGVKSATGAAVITYRCPTFHIDAGLTLSARDLRTAQKYVWRSKHKGWLTERIAEMKKQIKLAEKQKQKRLRVERSKRVDPLPGMRPAFGTPDHLKHY